MQAPGRVIAETLVAAIGKDTKGLLSGCVVEHSLSPQRRCKRAVSVPQDPGADPAGTVPGGPSFGSAGELHPDLSPQAVPGDLHRPKVTVRDSADAPGGVTEEVLPPAIRKLHALGQSVRIVPVAGHQPGGVRDVVNTADSVRGEADCAPRASELLHMAGRVPPPRPSAKGSVILAEGQTGLGPPNLHPARGIALLNQSPPEVVAVAGLHSVGVNFRRQPPGGRVAAEKHPAARAMGLRE